MDEWVSVCRLNEVRPYRVRTLSVNGVELIVGRLGAVDGASDDVVALEGRCPYRDAPLGDAELRDGMLICPLHGCVFELGSGISPYNPDQRLRVFAARIAGGLHGTLVQVRTPFRGPGVGDGYLARWAKRRGVEPELAYMRSVLSHETREPPSRDASPLETLTLTPVPLTERCSTTSEIDTECTLGFGVRRPLKLSMPVMIGHISYGEVSIEAKVALARGARQAGTAMGSGDGGAHGRERDAAGSYIVQALPGQRLSREASAAADAVELRIAEASSPGDPAALSAEYVSTEVGLHRGVPAGRPYVGGSYASWSQVEEDIHCLRELVDDVPVGVKIAAGSVEEDIAALLVAAPDYIVLDTVPSVATARHPRAGAHLAPAVGLDAPTAVLRAREVLDALPAHTPRPSLVVSGGFHRGDEVVKALALGADAVAISHAALLAVGCQKYRACDTGNCPVGIATHDPQLRLRLNADISASRVSAYLEHLREEIVTLCRGVGVASVSQLRGRIENKSLHAFS